MFGVFFSNHPDLRRILTDYGFERIGSPPPAGSKKVVLKFRSVNSMVIAPANTGSDNNNKNTLPPGHGHP
jgi:hypothetical protein